jgi:hypothetical protein
LIEAAGVGTWGSYAGNNDGGDSSGVASRLSSGVTQILSTGDAFAALKADGSVFTWGYSNYGGDSSAVASKLKNVVAFANPFTDNRLVLGGGAACFTISGNPAVGNTLVASFGSDDPDGNGAFTYSWQSSADGSSWSTVGSNSNNYTIRRSDQGKQIRLKLIIQMARALQRA